MDTTNRRTLTKKGSTKSLPKNSKFMNPVAPTCEDEQPDPALLERLGLLLGDHRVSKVKIQNHPHPILSHNSNNNSTHFNSTEKKKITAASHLTTSPASTLSDKGIGSSVGSFDSEFRNSKTNSLDSRRDDSPSHSRTDSGINNHARSSSDIGTGEFKQPTISEQLSGNLWNKDPRRGTENNIHPLAVKSATIDLKPRRLSKRSLRSVSSEASVSDKGSKSDLTKLPPVCPSRKSNSSSRDITPSASYTDIQPATKAMHSNKFPPEYHSQSKPASYHPSTMHEMNNNSTTYKDQWSGIQSSENAINEEFEKSYGVNYTGRSIIASITGGRSNIKRSLSTEENAPTGMHLNIQDAVAMTRDQDFGSASFLDNVTTPTNDILDIDSANDAIIQRMRTNSESGRAKSRQRLTESPSVPYEHRRGRSPNRAWHNGKQPGPANAPSPVPTNGHLSTAMAGIGLGRTDSTGRLVDNSHLYPSVGNWDSHRPQSVVPRIPTVNIHQPSPSLPVPLPSQSSFNRQNSNRSSTRSNPGEHRKPPRVPSDLRVSQLQPHMRVSELSMIPIYFELPHVVTTETKFIGRTWLYSEILNAFNTNNAKHNKGVLIYGQEGHGKTSILHHLSSTNIAMSNHRRQNSNASSNASTIRSRSDYGAMQQFPHGSNYSSRSGSPSSHQYYHQHQNSNNMNYSNASSRTASPAPNGGDSRGSSRQGSLTSIGLEDAFRRLSSQVVAVHYCSKQDNRTCYVPEFIHNIAAQLAQAPMLSAYRDFLMRDQTLQSFLRVRYCIQNPEYSLRKAIIEPLIMLRQAHKIPKVNLIILIDGLGEAEEYRPDHGHSIISFLQQHLNSFPDFLKIIATCKTTYKENLLDAMPMHFISLDDENNLDNANDCKAYIQHRIVSAASLTNLTLTGKPDPSQCHKLLTDHLMKLCQNNFLYLRLVLDLLEKRKLVPKSCGFKVIPINIGEVFLLMCNLKFQTSSSFDRVRDILSVTLASLYPLKDEQIFRAVTSGQLNQPPLLWEDFKDYMDSVSGFLILRPDYRRAYIHPAFREWLAEGTSDDCSSPISTSRKFLIDARRGHALLATVLSRQPVQLTKHACIELAHHLLKARMFKGQSKSTGVSSNDLHALWMAQCNAHLSESLTIIRNLFFPNLKISKLLLRAGANPNAPSQVLCEAPPICVAAHTGCIEFIDLLLQHGANINLSASNGMTAFAYAAAAGHVRAVSYLIGRRARMDLVDRNGHSPLLHAISRGHTEVAKMILTCNLFMSFEHRHFTAEQALVAAATIGNIELVHYLLENPEDALHCNVNIVDSVRGETPLSAAASRGKKDMCFKLIQHYRANIEMANKGGFTPLLCAVKHGQWETTEYLLNEGAFIEALDLANRTPLIVASSYGNIHILDLLLKKGAILDATDKENLNALGWAALKGHLNCASVLIKREINIFHKDNSGRTALDLAALFGHVEVVELLLSAGANPDEKDSTGLSTLDRAISGDNVSVVEKLLEYGVPITATSWAMASGKTNVTISLLKKTVDEGNKLYKVNSFKSASEIYNKALRHIGESITSKQNVENGNLPIPEFREMCSVLLLGLSRCARKLKDLDLAENAATRALQLIPGWFEALYVRARARREMSRFSAAFEDVVEAHKNAPSHNQQEIEKLIVKIKEELRKNGDVASENQIHLPKHRNNLIVTSSNSRSSPPHEPGLPPRPPRDQSPHHMRPTTLSNGQRQLPQLYPPDNIGMSSADSMPSLGHHPHIPIRGELHARLNPNHQGSYTPSPHMQTHRPALNYSRSHTDLPYDPSSYHPQYGGNQDQHGYNHDVPQATRMYGNRVAYQKKAATPPLPPKTRPGPPQNDPRQQQVYRSMSNLPYSDGLTYKNSIVTDL